ncbi:MAG: tetratricopeptide repeat protein [Chthoniobacterales bacterium]
MQRSEKPQQASQSGSLLVGALLALMVLLIYRPVVGFEFLRFDDDLYVTKNLEVQRGWSPGVVTRAAQANLAGNWQPVTFLSHALDVQFFALEAGRHHLVNALLHAINAVLLFALARRLGLPNVPAFFLAAIFALHPLRVESVAWVAERKDVLSTLFLLLSLLAYCSFARTRNGLLYATLLVCFALGLMSKVMLVTLPFALLVLDWWPLRRAQDWSMRSWTPLVMEKLPLLALSVIFCAVAVVAQRQAGALQDLATIPLAVRLETAVVAYAAYLGKSLWPAALSPFYTHPLAWPWWQVAGSAALLAAVTWAAWTVRRDRPWWLAGWLWYLGTLLPVIGLVQIGDQWMADRYTYIPLWGPLAAVICEGWQFSRRGPRQAAVMFLAGVLATSVLAWRTTLQLPVWKNTASLSAAGLQDGHGHWSMRTNEAIALAEQGRMAEAIAAFESIQRDYPQDAEAANNLGFALLSSGHPDRSLGVFRQAVQLDPANRSARVNLGQSLAATGRADEALAEFEQVMKADPGDPAAFAYAALICAESNPRRALELAATAARLSPRPSLLALDATARAQAALGEQREAAGTWRQAAEVARRSGQSEAAAQFESRARATGF